MTQESEFRPSLIGRILDHTINALPWTPPADIQIGLLRTMGPYKKVLEGKIVDPEKAVKVRGDFNLWYKRLYEWAHRKDNPEQI